MATLSNRDPYPFPRLQTEQNFCGSRPLQVAPKTNSWTIVKNSNEVYGVPTHLAQQQDPWNRLNYTPTLTSSRREVYHFDPLAPRDELDFTIKSMYNHHGDLFYNRNQTLFQYETYGEDQAGRKLKNRTKVVPKQPLVMNHPLCYSDQKQRMSIHSVKNAIEGAHSEETNAGYSRKGDGGFFVF